MTPVPRSAPTSGARWSRCSPLPRTHADRSSNVPSRASMSATPTSAEPFAEGANARPVHACGRPLGSGGMGTVWLARQSRADRTRRRDQSDQTGPWTRRRSSRASNWSVTSLARLAHPHIATVLDAGSHAARSTVPRHGVRGRHAAHDVRRTPMSLSRNDRLRLFAQICARGAPRPPARHHAPRPQARESARHRGGRRAARRR